jgi:hypothetical protein
MSDVYVMMGRLSDSISIVTTASRALAAAEDQEGTTIGADLSDEITAMTCGVKSLRAAYRALDEALAVSP